MKCWRTGTYVMVNMAVMKEDTMASAETIRKALHRVGRWRDLLWESVLDEFAERDATAVEAARAVIRAQPTRAIFGASTRDAVEAWPHLDAQARQDWVCVCQLVHNTWMEDFQSATETAD
jgi:predicted TPR repeat methyltransferase